MDRNTVIAKIKKCLALAQSSNPHEAAVAMKQAQKLMAAHGLDVKDVQLSDVGEKSHRATSNMLPNWEVQLAHTVCDAFGCTNFVKRGHIVPFMGKPQRKTDYVFVGIGPASDVAAYAFSVLQRQCAADRLAHVKAQPKRLKPTTRSARGDAFALAWVNAVRQMLDAFAGLDPKQAQLLDDYLAQHYPDMGQAKVQRREVNRHVRDDSEIAGAEAGSKARLHRGVAGKKQELLK